MKLAISNLAWNPDEDAEVAGVLASLGVTGIELAPTKTWADLNAATESEASQLRSTWQGRGLKVCALQSLLFGRNDLVIFGNESARIATGKLLEKIITIAGWLGAGALVFGSPKNRLRGALTVAEANKIAIPFFKTLGEHAAKCGTALCIEPNPAEYGADYILTADEGSALVAEVDSSGFGLHLDSAGMYLSGENGVESIRRNANYLRHFHISAPQLAAVNANSPVDYRGLVNALAAAKYTGWISIEMKQNPAGGNVTPVKTAVETLRRIV